MSKVKTPGRELKKFLQAYADPESEHALELRGLVLEEAPKAFELIYDSL